MKSIRLFLCFALGFWLLPMLANAEEASNEELFSRGVQALEGGDHGRAIALFESLADRGFVHPDAAFNRGLSYLARIRAKQGKPGDLGRAAAGFHETLISRPGDQGAKHAIELIEAEVTRRGVRSGQGEQQSRPSLDRVIVQAAPEAFWAWAALVASLVLTVGLVLRRRHMGALHLAGLIQTPIGLIGLVVFAVLAGRAHHLRTSTIPAVVVVSEARFLDEKGSALPQENPVPEATLIEIIDHRAALVMIRHGQRQGWTHGSSLRELPH